jgi:hypothetical protein
MAAGPRFAPGRTGKVRGPAAAQDKGFAADSMAEFRPGRTIGFADYKDEGASDIMSKITTTGLQTPSQGAMEGVLS